MDIKKIGLILLIFVGINHALFGAVYLTTNELMPYHLQALKIEWEDINSNYRILFLALLKLVGIGGFIAGVINLVLSISAFYKPKIQFLWLLPIVVLSFQLVMNYVVYTVYVRTPGEPPLLYVSIGTAISITGILFVFIKDIYRRN